MHEDRKGDASRKSDSQVSILNQHMVPERLRLDSFHTPRKRREQEPPPNLHKLFNFKYLVSVYNAEKV